MSEMPSEQVVEVVQTEIAPNFDSNFESNLKPVRVEPTFPLTRTEAAKLLGKSDVAIGKTLRKLQDAYATQPEKMFALTDVSGKITEWGFGEIIKMQRETSPEIPDYNHSTGEIYWTEQGTPVRMIDNPDRIHINEYLEELSSNLNLLRERNLIDNTGVSVTPVEIDTNSAIVTAQANQLDAQQAMNRAMEHIDNTQARYLNMRAMRRRNIAALALKDSAEDAELYTKVYDANLSRAISSQASGLQENQTDDES